MIPSSLKILFPHLLIGPWMIFRLSQAVVSFACWHSCLFLVLVELLNSHFTNGENSQIESYCPSCSVPCLFHSTVYLGLLSMLVYYFYGLYNIPQWLYHTWTFSPPAMHGHGDGVLFFTVTKMVPWKKYINKIKNLFWTWNPPERHARRFINKVPLFGKKPKWCCEPLLRSLTWWIPGRGITLNMNLFVCFCSLKCVLDLQRASWSLGLPARRSTAPHTSC